MSEQPALVRAQSSPAAAPPRPKVLQKRATSDPCAYGRDHPLKVDLQQLVSLGDYVSTVRPATIPESEHEEKSESELEQKGEDECARMEESEVTASTVTSLDSEEDDEEQQDVDVAWPMTGGVVDASELPPLPPSMWPAASLMLPPPQFSYMFQQPVGMPGVPLPWAWSPAQVAPAPAMDVNCTSGSSSEVEEAPASAAPARSTRGRGSRRRKGGSGPGAIKREKAPLGEGDCTLHVSCNMLQEDLKLRLERAGFANLFDFLWVPMKSEEKRTEGKPSMHGYAWINFISVEVAQKSASYFADGGCVLPCDGEAQVLRCRLQGLPALKEHITGRWFPKDGRPLVLHEGQMAAVAVSPNEDRTEHA